MRKKNVQRVLFCYLLQYLINLFFPLNYINIYKIHLKCLPNCNVCDDCGIFDRCFPSRSYESPECGCKFSLLHRADVDIS